jgi:tetratricopeptide (TPR) repeat protein
LAKWQRQNLPQKKVLQEELWSWKGRIFKKQGQQKEALDCFQKSFANSRELPNTKGRSFYVVSGYLAGEILYDRNEFGQAKSYLSNIVDADAESGYRKQARELLSKIEHR